MTIALRARHRSRARFAALALACAPLALAAPLLPATSAFAATAKPAPVAELVKTVRIPYEQFTLPNGLRVIVHTDRKAPVVAVSIWYDVGSKNEPKGKTGFAHLFEHLMFNGSENAPGDFFEPLQQVGATDFNGTTWFDRTNYFQTVPTSALDVALFLESDRMGHLLGAVTQEKLDNQRGVVQNEKRQGDNQPYGLVEYAQLAGLLPEGHPYAHSTIGSMADLDAASLDDVKQWFVDHYGPNNAVLVLAGDIDLATAQAKVSKWFGAIPAGKKVVHRDVPIPTLPARKELVMKDRVAATRIYRTWTGPGLNHPDAVPLFVGASVLGGLSSSRLDNALVRKEQLAVRVSADVQQHAQLSFIEVSADVKPGVDPAVVGKRIDELLAEFLAKGPTKDEVSRVATRTISGKIGGLEQVGGFSGKAVTLAEGALYSNDAGFYRKQFAALAKATPKSVATAMRTWLSRPTFAITVEPGEREAYDEAGGKRGAVDGSVTIAPTGPGPARYLDEGEEPQAMAFATADAAGTTAAPDRSKLPDVGAVPNIDFPTVDTVTLSNGIKVHVARRDTVPAVRMSMVFNAGIAADRRDRPGTQQLMLSLLNEGTTTRNSIQIAEEQERLGAGISIGASLDRTTVGLYALTANLEPSLDLFADVIKNPAFAPEELERLRVTQLARISQELSSPTGLAGRALPPILFGADHPYGVPSSGLGTPASVKAITRDDLASFHRKWIRPDNAEIFVVGAVDAKTIAAALEKRFGLWPVTRDLPGRKDFSVTPPAPQPRIVLVDRPQSPQSIIVGGLILDAKGTDDLDDLLAANDILGGSFLSRINMDLRETKGWSYGVRGSVARPEGPVSYVITAPVQADRTGDSILALREQFTRFLTTEGVTQAERDRTVNGNIRELPGSYETSGSVLGQMQRDAQLGRPFDYVEGLAKRYEAQTVAALDAAARQKIAIDRFTWVVVGDKSIVLPQLDKVGLPVTVVDGASIAGN